MTISGSPIALSDQYSMPVNNIVPSASRQSSLAKNFANYLGFTSCSAGGIDVNATALVPVRNATATITTSFATKATANPPANASTSTLPTSNAAQSSTTDNQGLDTSQKAGVGVGVSLSVLLGILILWILWRRRRERQVEPSTNSAVKSDGPFLQQKAELAEEEHRRKLFELEAKTPCRELEGAAQIEKGDSDRPPEMKTNEPQAPEIWSPMVLSE